MFEKILFGTDFSENSHWALTYALDLAKNYNSKLFILHVTPVPKHPEQISNYLSPEKLQELMIVHRDEIEKEFTYYLRKLKGFKNHKILLNEGEPFVEIIQMAKKRICRSHRDGYAWKDWLGSCSFREYSGKGGAKITLPCADHPAPGEAF